MNPQEVFAGRFPASYGGLVEIAGGKLLHITTGLSGCTSADGAGPGRGRRTI